MTVCLYIILGIAWIISESAGGRTQILRNLLQSNNSGSLYDNRVPPNFEDDYPTNVTVQIYILSFDSVTESAMEYSVSIFLRQNWEDHRLRWASENITGHLEVDPKYMNLVWMPDLYFVNEKEALVHDVTVANKLLHIHKNGSINSSMRISMTLSCDMFLERYPHDEQECSIALGSYSYSAENVAFHWHPRPVVMRERLTLPRFKVNYKGASDCTYLMGEENMATDGDGNAKQGGGGTLFRFPNGQFTCIQADFRLLREFGYYIAQVYVPSILIVVLSWVSFWIDLDAIPARVSLGLLTVLAMTTQSTGEKAALPKVSYVKAIDVWMAVCLFFVFTALLEFAYVNVQSRVEKRRRESVMVNTSGGKTPHRNIDVIHDPHHDGHGIGSRRFVFIRDRARVQKARFVDKCSRIAFPVAFIIFNIIYWVYYRQGGH